MIFGTGIDIVEVSRFEKWLKDKNCISRYFNKKEILSNSQTKLNERQSSALCQHYAARFAAKEAFSKALGTGIAGFELKNVYVQNDELGKPYLVLENNAKELFEKKCKNAKIYLSLSHEKHYAIANVIIEI